MGRSAALQAGLHAYFYVAIWMAVSMSVILFNKWLLAFAGFPFPITLTLWHMAVCSAAGALAVRVLRITPSHNMAVEDWVTRVLPIGMLYAASLWLSNTAYLSLSVSFIQMTKSLMPGLVFLAGCAAATERFRWPVALTMALIAAGVGVCALGERRLEPRGLITQLAALCFEAVRLTLVQVLINSRGMKMDSFQSLYYVSPACLLCLLVPFLAVELPGVRALLADPSWALRPGVFLANAATAVALNLSVFLLIGKTSALTMNIAGVLKDWLLIYSSYSVFHAPVTPLNLAGYVFCCSGVFIYQWLKYKEAARTPTNTPVAAKLSHGGKEADGPKGTPKHAAGSLDANSRHAEAAAPRPRR